MLKYSTHLTVKEIHKIKYSTIHLLIFSYVFWLVYGHAFFVGVYDVFYCYKLARLTNVQWTAYLLTYLLSIQFTLSKNSTDSHNTKYTRFASHRAALISVSVALRQTSAYTARPRTRGIARCACLHSSLSLVATVPTDGGMARPSWPEVI